MLSNYFIIAWRNLIRNKGYSLLNIAGLAVALAVFLVIIQYIRHETSYDQYLPESDQVYRLLMHNNENGSTDTDSPPGITGHMRTLYPEITHGVQVTPPTTAANLFEYAGTRIYESGLMHSPPEFFQIFQYEFIHGTREGSLDEPDAVVLTESLSEKLFGDQNPVGRSITIDKEDSHTITGVVKDPPSNTHMRFSAVAQRREFSRDTFNSWGIRTGKTYFRLDSEDVSSLQEKMPDYVRNWSQFSSDTDLATREIWLQPLDEVFLYPSGKEGGSDKMVYIRIFFSIAFLILLIACVNYINLATARSVDRAREIGVRKTLGASRWQVAQQVMAETLVTCGLAFGLGFLLMELSLPYLQQMLDLDLAGLNWYNPEGLAILSVMLIGVALLSGAYCAFYLSSFSPMQTIAKSGSGMRRSTSYLRKALVVGQFAVSLIVIIATVLIARQMDHIQETRLDGEDSRILVVKNRSGAMNQQFRSFRQALIQHGSVAEVSAGDMLGNIRGMKTVEDSTGGSYRVTWMGGTFGYVESLGLELLSGRYLNPEIASDSSGNVLINEAAARQLGIGEAAGQYVPDPIDANVVGIIEDFHTQSFYQRINPLVIQFNDGSAAMDHIFVRFHQGQTSEGLQQVRETWESFQTEFPFDYAFLDQELDHRYRSELRMAGIFSGFAGFSIFIACLGLFGLAAFSARQRTKEIGIRKVLGATVSNIVQLLSREFLLLVALGFLLSIPVAWYGVSQWLQNFAYRIDMNLWLFAAVGGAVLLTALLTVSGQSLKAAMANPVDSLRSE